MGTQPPSQKVGGGWGQSPKFSAHGYCGRTARWIKMALGMEVGLGPVHIVLDGDTVPLPKTGGRPPKILSAHLYCGQTAGCIKMQPGTEVGFGLRDIVFDVHPVPHKKGTPTPPNFWPMFIVAKWLDG